MFAGTLVAGNLQVEMGLQGDVGNLDRGGVRSLKIMGGGEFQIFGGPLSLTPLRGKCHQCK